MKKLAYVALCWTLLACQPALGALSVTQLGGFGASVGLPDVTYSQLFGIGASSTSSSYTSSGKNLGTCASGTKINVMALSVNSASVTVSSITIDGLTPTLDVAAGSGASNASALIYHVTGASDTGDVVVNLSGSARVNYGMYVVCGAQSATPVGTNGSGSTTPSFSVTSAAGGVVIGVAFEAVSGTPTITLSGLTEDGNRNVLSGQYTSWGSATTTGSSVTVGATYTGSGGSIYGMAAAAWR